MRPATVPRLLSLGLAGLIEATVEAGKIRLRPILMTTIATIVGLIPMAPGVGEGALNTSTTCA